MKILLFLALGALCMDASADVILYKTVVTNVYIGTGTAQKLVETGRLVYDPFNAGTAKLISWAKEGTKTYFRVDCVSMDAKYVRGPSNSDQSALFISGQGFNIDTGKKVTVLQTYLRGVNSSVPISATNNLRTPKVAKGPWRQAYQDRDQIDYLVEGTLVATLMLPATQNANANKQTVDDVINAIVESFKLGGWIQNQGQLFCD